MKDLIQRRLNTLLHDFRGSVLWIVDNGILSTMSSFYSIWNRVIAFLWGIEIGRLSKFYGKTHFKRYPGSKITIGKKCLFRSAFRSNMAGLNHPCAVSTHTKNAIITIGDNSGFSGTIIGAAKQITIGNNVSCGANVTITDFDWHNILPNERSRGGVDFASPVVIEDNVWLGLNCLVLKGVHIGKNAVIGANSVITSAVPANTIVAGNPAKIVRKLNIAE